MLTATSSGPIPTPPPTTSCFEVSTQYDSHRSGNANLEKSYHSVGTAQECQNVCVATTGCNCFTYNTNQGRCWLMTACQTATHNAGFTSGPKVCPPPVDIII